MNFISGLVIKHNINPILLDLGSLKISYYGIIYAVGFIVTFMWLRNAVKDKKINFTLEDVDSFFIYAVVGVVLGSRLFEAIFYSPSLLYPNPLEFFKIWKGGLSFHGGAAGGAFAIWLFTRKKKVAFYDLADIVVMPISIALALGRIANFINGELYGYPTNGDWGVIFMNETASSSMYAAVPRHPTQIYESLKNLLIFYILLKISKKFKKRGLLAWAWVFLYGLFRFIIEFFKDFAIIVPSINLTRGHALCLAMMIISVIFIYKIYNKKDAPLRFEYNK